MRKLFLLLTFALPTYAQAVCFDSIGCVPRAKLEEALQNHYKSRDAANRAFLEGMTPEERNSLPPGTYESITRLAPIKEIKVSELVRTPEDAAVKAEKALSAWAKFRGKTDKTTNVGSYANVILNVTREGESEEQIHCTVKAGISQAAVFVECANRIQSATVSYASLGLATPENNM